MAILKQKAYKRLVKFEVNLKRQWYPVIEMLLRQQFLEVLSQSRIQKIRRKGSSETETRKYGKHHPIKV